MANFNTLITNLQLQEWFVLSIPFLVMTGLAVWLLTPAGARISRRGFRRAGRAAGLFRRAAPRSPVADLPSEPAENAASEPVRETVTSPVFDTPEPCAISAPEAAEEEASAAPDAGPVNKRCKMDLAATKNGLELTVELPGVEERDLKIQVVDDVLTISGHMSFEPDREERNYRLVERDYGTFSRSIDLPPGIAADRIRASLSYGVLKLKIPNPAKPTPTTIDVQGPPMGFCETADGLQMTVDLPGLDEGEVEVSLSNGLLTVSGARRAELGAEAALQRHGGDHHRPLSRSVALPDWVGAHQIAATLNNGVLTISIPHPATPAPKRIEVRAAVVPTAERRGSPMLVGE